MPNRQEVPSKNNCENIANCFCFPLSVFYLFSKTVYKDSVVDRARKRRSTPTSDHDSYFSEDNDGGGEIP